MLLRFFLGLLFASTLHACTSAPVPQQIGTANLIDSTNSNMDQNIFGDNFDNEKDLYKIVFSSILDSTYYKNPSLFLKNLNHSYNPENRLENSILAVEQHQLFGLKDSIWFVNCLSTVNVNTADSCAFPMLQTQYLFNQQGRLVYKSEANKAQFIPTALDSMAIYMTITNDCEGNGQHHFYVYQQGKLIDIFNVLMNNTPKTYDANPEGGVFRNNHLDAFVQDLNQDGFKDILLKGKWLVLDNGKGRKYPITRPFKAESVEYSFLYHPTKEAFLLVE